MIEGIPRISVKIITYKQENLIKRAINSLLAQKDYIYEICVSDDCSPDETWNVLRQYAKEYPGLFKLNRNDHNLGIFENIEQSWKMPTGDIVYSLAGDDEAGENWFKTVVEYIQKNNIDYKNELFCIYGDHMCKYPNGDTYVHKNDNAVSGLSLLKMYERGLISNRASCYSIKILRKHIAVSQGRSFIVENAIDAQLHIFTEKAYYINKVGNIYYSAVGVSRSISDARALEHEQTMFYAFDFFRKIGVEIDDKDALLPNYNIAEKHFRRNQSFSNFYKLLKAYIACYDKQVGIKSLHLHRMLFRIVRKLPHKKNIHW